jgi:RNA polymerase sigma factor (sigma-70 family)
MENLTERVLQYQRTREGLQEIVRELAPRVYAYPRRKMGWDEDACGDFYVFIHPRLIRLLDRFRDQGKPFESYLFTVLGWQLRNFARDRRQGERRWNVSLRLEPGADEYADPIEERRGGTWERVWRIPGCFSQVVRSRADRRNFLFLVLKCSRTVAWESIGSLAESAHIEEQRLRELISMLQEVRCRREKRLETFRERRNRAFAMARLLETELRSETEPLKVRGLEESLFRARRRMRLAMERMSRVALSPTNREIAEALGVPKGTVDSGLYWLKRKLSSVYDPDIHWTA